MTLIFLVNRSVKKLRVATWLCGIMSTEHKVALGGMVYSDPWRIPACGTSGCRESNNLMTLHNRNTIKFDLLNQVNLGFIKLL